MRAIRYLIALALALAPLPSSAAVVTVTAGTGTPFETVLDPSATNNISLFSLCGPTSATIPANCANQAIVSTDGSLQVTALSADFADGALVTLGTKADAAWTSGSGSEISILKGIDRDILGNADPCNSATRTVGLPVAFSSATTLQIAAAGSGSQNVYICELIGIPNGANNITIVSGNGTNCATNQVTIGGPWYLGNAGNGLDLGKGITSFMVTQTAGYEICATTSTSAAISIQAISVLK